jgi:DNA-binding LacI/PurR family transcriptional regulator
VNGNVTVHINSITTVNHLNWDAVANNKRVIISDVAEEAGVSKQTVSRVINNRPDVADHTRKRIKEIIARLGYHPDPIARSMRGDTHTLGCITPNLSDYNFSSIVQAAQAEARNSGYFLLTGSAQSEQDVQSLLNEIMSRRVDGLLVINPRDDNRYLHFLPLIEQGVPVVYIKNTPVDENVSAVSLDDVSGGYLATLHLIGLGHRKIATILGLPNEECTKGRLAGFHKAYHEAGLQVNPKLLAQGDWSASSGNQAIKDLLAKGEAFSAVFAQNDRMAVGAIQALREAGFKVPEDISVIGYDDIPLSSYFDPPMTTVRQPMEAFGRIGAQILIEALNNHAFVPQIVRLAPELIVRKTSAPYHA